MYVIIHKHYISFNEIFMGIEVSNIIFFVFYFSRRNAANERLFPKRTAGQRGSR